MKGKHVKHPPIKRPSRGMYHKNEWAIYGTTCANIEAHVKSIMSQLSTYRITYVDADHSEVDMTTDLQIGKKQFQSNNLIHWNEYDDRLQSWPADLVLVNGNHFPAQRQIVIIDDNKKDSLQRRVDQLTQIDIVIAENESAIYDFVREKMTEKTKVLSIGSEGELFDYLKKEISGSNPQLKAVVLAGGESRRMGTDKSTLEYHGKSQQLYMAELCQSLGLETYISKSHDFTAAEVEGIAVISDKLVKMGPYGAIVSAMMNDPDAAWLVLACDLPHIDKDTLQRLISERDSRVEATAVRLESQRFPEPLISIYEPSIYQRMLRFLSLGYACPRKVLINSHIKELVLQDESVAFNANTPEEHDAALTRING